MGRAGMVGREREGVGAGAGVGAGVGTGGAGAGGVTGRTRGTGRGWTVIWGAGGWVDPGMAPGVVWGIS